MSADDQATKLPGLREILAAWRMELGALFGGAFESESRETVVRSERDMAQARTRDVVLELPAEDVLRPTVRLPYASERVLRSALNYELEKLSPVSPEEVYFDFKLLKRDRAENAADVELRIIRRDVVDPLLALCRAAGLKVAAIRFAGDARDADPNTFPVDKTAALRGQWRRNNVALVTGAAAALLLALVFVTYMRGSEALDALSDQVASEGMRAARVEQLNSRIERTTQQLAFLGQQKRSPLFAQILADVARALPDGTWISEIDVTGNKIRIEGSSRAASDLIAVFDRSGRFANAQFAAPVTQGGAPGIEHFDLTFEVVGAAK